MKTYYIKARIIGIIGRDLYLEAEHGIGLAYSVEVEEMEGERFDSWGREAQNYFGYENRDDAMELLESKALELFEDFEKSKVNAIVEIVDEEGEVIKGF
jgi:hypothetical protein